MTFERMTILFDEYGTPTFRKDRENEFFIGVGIGYKQSDEEEIFYKVGDLIGLQKIKSLKNNKISNKRAAEIAKTLKQLPLFLVVVAMNLSDQDLINTVSEYCSISNKIRENERELKGRPIAQILHSRVLDNCLFESITLCIENDPYLNNFDVFIDNWSIPNEDISIYLNLRSESFSRQISNLFPDVTVSPIQLLDEDSKRKRFIDSVTSVVSRYYYDKLNDKFTDVPFNILFINNLNNMIILDITQKEILFINEMLKIATGHCHLL